MRLNRTTWNEEVLRLEGCLRGLAFTDHQRVEIAVDDAYARWHDLTVQLRHRRGTVFLIGNGASASMASHYAADLAKNAHLHAQVFSDLALITAISNDIAFDQVFAEPLRRRAQPDDILVAISSSGRSPNILNAVAVANEMEMKVMTLSAMDRDNPLRQSGWLNAYVPAEEYGYAETCHAAVLHHWMDLVELEAPA